MLCVKNRVRVWDGGAVCVPSLWDIQYRVFILADLFRVPSQPYKLFRTLKLFKWIWTVIFIDYQANSPMCRRLAGNPFCVCVCVCGNMPVFAK